MSSPSRIIPPVPGVWPSWEALMAEALVQARAARSFAEVPVGAVLVSARGDIIGCGRNRPLALRDPTAHAEIMALRDAGQHRENYRLEGSVLVVTLEPCLMCVGALAHARVAGVVYGAADIRAGAVTSCLDGFEQPFLNHAVWHMGGICEEECATLLQDFFNERRP